MAIMWWWTKKQKKPWGENPRGNFFPRPCIIFVMLLKNITLSLWSVAEGKHVVNNYFWIDE